MVRELWVQPQFVLYDLEVVRHEGNVLRLILDGRNIKFIIFYMVKVTCGSYKIFTTKLWSQFTNLVILYILLNRFVAHNSWYFNHLRQH